MKGRDLRRARTEIGLAREDLADLVEVTPGVLDDWERFDTKIPKETAQRLQWAIWTVRQEKILERSGLPECEQVKALGEDHADLQVILRHLGDCDVCRARADYARKHAPPVPGDMGMLARVMGFAGRLPGLPRSAFYGFLTLLFFTGIGVLWFLVLGIVRGDASMVGAAFALLAITASGGASGGVVHHFTRGLRERGAVGYYASWISTMYGYLVGALAPVAAGMALVGPEALDEEALEMVGFLTTPAGAVSVAALGALFGVFVGRQARTSDAELLEEMREGANDEKSGRGPLSRRRPVLLAVFLGLVAVGLRLFEGGATDASTMDDYREALPGLEAAAAAEPDNPEALSELGYALAVLGRHEEALEAYEQALRLDPESASTHSGLAYTLAQLGRFQEAAQAGHEAARLDPGDGWTRSFLARMLFELKRYEDALPEAEAAVEIDPGDPIHQETLALVLVGLGREEEALPRYREAARLAPEDPRLWRDRARLAHMLHDFEEAAASYERVDRLDPTYFERMPEDREMWDEAVAAIRRE